MFYPHGTPRLINRRTALLHLVACGLIERRQLVESNLTVSELPGRNRVFLITLDGAPHLVIKQCGEPLPYRLQGIAREHECLSFAAKSAGIRERLPQAIHFDRRHGILVMKHETGTPLNRHLHRNPDQIITCSNELGKALRTVHVALSNTADELAGKLTRDLPWALRKNGMLGKLPYRPSRGQSELAVEFSRHPEIATGIEEAREFWRTDSVINGDMKSANCLWREEDKTDSPVFLDWEHVIRGDAAWDVAGLLQSIVIYYAIPKPTEEPQTLRELSDHATENWPRMTRATSAFFQGYVDHRTDPATGDDEFIERMLRYTGARLIQTAAESLKARSSLSAESLLLLQVGINLLNRPADHQQLANSHEA